MYNWNNRRRKGNKGTEKIAEEINENFCKLVSVVKLQNQETQNMLIRMNPQIKCTSA
jgi:hypothetical protein